MMSEITNEIRDNKLNEPFFGVVAAQMNDCDCCLSCYEDLEVC
jgi:hypothetical protein